MLPSLSATRGSASNRANVQVAERFTDAKVRKNIDVDLVLVDSYDKLIVDVERYLEQAVRVEGGATFFRLRSIPGVGKILALVLLYEIHNIGRFATVGDFVSYARLVRPEHESAGKKCGFGQKKIGNAHLRWAFAEAATLLLRESEAKRWLARKEKKHGKGKALGILAAKLGRAVYWMLRRQEDFDAQRFWQS